MRKHTVKFCSNCHKPCGHYRKKFCSDACVKISEAVYIFKHKEQHLAKKRIYSRKEREKRRLLTGYSNKRKPPNYRPCRCCGQLITRGKWCKRESCQQALVKFNSRRRAEWKKNNPDREAKNKQRSVIRAQERTLDALLGKLKNGLPEVKDDPKHKLCVICSSPFISGFSSKKTCSVRCSAELHKITKARNRKPYYKTYVPILHPCSGCGVTLQGKCKWCASSECQRKKRQYKLEYGRRYRETHRCRVKSDTATREIKHSDRSLKEGERLRRKYTLICAACGKRCVVKSSLAKYCTGKCRSKVWENNKRLNKLLTAVV